MHRITDSRLWEKTWAKRTANDVKERFMFLLFLFILASFTWKSLKLLLLVLLSFTGRHGKEVRTRKTQWMGRKEWVKEKARKKAAREVKWEKRRRELA